MLLFVVFPHFTSIFMFVSHLSSSLSTVCILFNLLWVFPHYFSLLFFFSLFPWLHFIFPFFSLQPLSYGPSSFLCFLIVSAFYILGLCFHVIAPPFPCSPLPFSSLSSLSTSLPLPHSLSTSVLSLPVSYSPFFHSPLPFSLTHAANAGASLPRSLSLSLPLPHWK